MVEALFEGAPGGIGPAAAAPFAAEARLALLRLLERAVDLLHELRDDGEPERAPPLRLARLEPDAVVANREDPAIALALRADPDGAAPAEGESVLEGIGQ